MKIKYFIRGLGVGVIVSTLLLFMTYSYKLSDTRVISRAKELGMVYGGNEEESTTQKLRETGDGEKKETEDVQTSETEMTSLDNQEESTTILSGEGVDVQATTENETHTIVITSGMTSGQVSRMLEQAGLVDSADAFDEYLMKNGKTVKLQKGQHILHKNMTYEEIADTLTKK